MRYKIRKGARINGDAQSIGKALERVRKKNKGRLTSQVVVEDAQNELSKLHPFFEWDDGIAAEKYRLHQASVLICSVMVVPDKSDRQFEPVRAFVCVHGEEDAEAGHEFVPVSEAMRDEIMRKNVVERAKEELADWRRRYDNLAAFADLYSCIDETLKEAA